jgi:hypothetical protein
MLLKTAALNAAGTNGRGEPVLKSHKMFTPLTTYDFTVKEGSCCIIIQSVQLL